MQTPIIQQPPFVGGDRALDRKIGRLVPPVLTWFAANARDLPWRRTLDPYAIWVAEIMLQQTQVQTVRSYWERWIEVFPSVRALAKAAPETVLKLWEGLGYYTRARNLHLAARRVVEDHGGILPTEYSAVLALPGIGRYTAGAICSIAFDQPVPLLDGNVIRLLTRLFGVRDAPKSPRGSHLLWQLADKLVQAAHHSRTTHLRPCSALNQGLMELGALVCLPRSPQCSLCPVSKACWARKHRQIEHLPNVAPRPAATERRFTAWVVEAGNRYWVRRRPDRGVNAFLWEFPNAEIAIGTDRLPRWVDALGLPRPGVAEPWLTIRHSITRYRIHLEVFRVAFALRPALVPAAGEWKTLKELRDLAFPSAHGRIVRRLNGQDCP